MKLHIGMLGASVMFVVVGNAAANNHKYPWCSAISTDQGQVSDGDKFRFNSDADDIPNGDGRDVLYDIALGSCGQTGSGPDAFDKQLTAARERWSKRLELSEAEWKDVAAYTTLEQYDREGNGIERIEVKKRTYESLTPLEQFSIVQYGTSSGEGADLEGGIWTADILGGHLSAAGHLAVLKQCISSTDPVEMAYCATDAAAFDAHKVFEEMHADTSANGGARIEVRLFADGMRREIPKFQARVAALVKADPSYGKMFDLAAQTAKQWDAMYAAHDPNVDIALQMDDAFVTNSRKAFEGCAPRTRAAWLKTVSAIPAKRFAKMYATDDKSSFSNRGLVAVLQNPDAYLAGFALMLCAHDANDDAVRSLGGSIGMVVQRWAGYRGPHNAIISAVVSAGFEFDDRSVELAQPKISHEWIRPKPLEKPAGGGTGAIAKIAAKGNSLHVEFVLIGGSEEACAEGNFSHRIEAIRDDGSVQYHYDCKKWKMITTEKGSPPTDIDAGFAVGLKPGMKALIIRGIVWAAWATPKSETPVIVFGATVK